jgi:hypothetical protein
LLLVKALNDEYVAKALTASWATGVFVGSKDGCIADDGCVVVNALLNPSYLYLVSKISFRETPLIGFRLVIFLLILSNVSSFPFHPGGRVNSVT